MLKCDGNKNQPSPLLPKAYRDDCYLTVQDLNATGITSQIVNNQTAFVIKSVDGTPNGGAIKFGQPFAITTLDGSVRYLTNKINQKLESNLLYFNFRNFCIVILSEILMPLENLACKKSIL